MSLLPENASDVRLAVAYWEDGGVYPRAARGRRRRESYWRNVATMTATWRHVTDVATEVVVYSNARPHGHVARVLDDLGVEIVQVPFATAPPKGHVRTFSGSLYSIDVLRTCAVDLGERTLVLVDPDVVWVRDPAPLLERGLRRGLVVHEIPYDTDRRELDVTRRELGEMFRELHDDPGLPEVPVYPGGELVVVQQQEISELVAQAEEAWEASLRWAAEGRTTYPRTEEHLLSYALWRRGWSRGNADDIVRRIWTVPPPRNVDGTEDELIAWHLPQEKASGLWRLYDDLRAQRGPFAVTEPAAYRAALARRVGVTTGPARRGHHVLRRVARRAAGRPALPPNEG